MVTAALQATPAHLSCTKQLVLEWSGLQFAQAFERGKCTFLSVVWAVAKWNAWLCDWEGRLKCILKEKGPGLEANHFQFKPGMGTTIAAVTIYIFACMTSKLKLGISFHHFLMLSTVYCNEAHSITKTILWLLSREVPMSQNIFILIKKTQDVPITLKSTLSSWVAI